MTIAYLIIAGVLCLGTLYKIFLTVLYFSQRNRVLIPPLPTGEVPFVTVQLPLYNEKFVVERLLRAVAALDYPRDRLEIQVLDDSTDETSALVSRLAEEIPLVHVRRPHRRDYKAGALAEGCLTARGELLAIFDADFVPGPDFLRKTVPYFRDGRVGAVQARWGYLNFAESLLTRLQALYLNAHFRIEHAARAGAGAFFHFNGSAGVWRKSAIESAGGWRGRTLTEDLDLSYRAHLKGWRFVFLSHVEVPSELPSTIPALQAQQFRWAKGMTQTARFLLPEIWKERVPLWKKMDATFHLFSPATYLATLVGALALIPYLSWRGDSPVGPVEAALSLGVLSNFLFYVISERESGSLTFRRSLDIVAGIPLGVALSVNGTRALFAGLFSNGGEFVRTPKKGAAARAYVPLSPLSLPWEFLFALAFLMALVMARPDLWPIVIILGSGFWYLTLGAVQRIYARTLQRAQ